MKVRHLGIISLLGAFLLALAGDKGTPGMVVADHALASEAGARVLRQGGNAVDAAVATALACGVVQPASSGLGGGGFAVVHGPAGSQVLDFREIAPAAAHANMFQDDAGNVVPGASTEGGLAVGVPGEPRGLVDLWRAHGRLPLATVAAPAIALARDGFSAGDHLRKSLAQHPGVPFSSLWPLTDLDRVQRPRLAGAIAAWAQTQGLALIRGKLAWDLVEAVQRAGGILTRQDLADYHPTPRKPLRGTYRGLTLLTMPPPSSGGVVLLQVLGVLESIDFSGLEHNSPEHLHLLAEAFQHAYADRAATMGDPAFVDVPVELLLSPERIQAIQADFDPTRTFDRDHYGTSLDPGTDGGTQHIAVLDGEGMGVALTTTINTAFGSKVVAPASSIVLNNEMDDFVAKPGVPNAYGLVGREANAVAPGKKPLSSMTPTLVLDADGNLLLSLGASGGPFIISSTLQVLSNIVDFGMTPEEALAVPRMHHQWVPEKLFLDTGYSSAVQPALEALGHTVEEMPFFSSVQVVQATGGGFLGAADPHKGGAPAESR
jgi:gamma-glutamyltranspeptidase/glutathione hydrolase